MSANGFYTSTPALKLILSNKGIKMPRYNVYASEVVFYVQEVEADSEDEAVDRAWDNFDGWKNHSHDNWQIETVEPVKPAEKEIIDA